jgi:hypothetical protein
VIPAVLLTAHPVPPLAHATEAERHDAIAANLDHLRTIGRGDIVATAGTATTPQCIGVVDAVQIRQLVPGRYSFEIEWAENYQVSGSHVYGPYYDGSHLVTDTEPLTVLLRAPRATTATPAR